MEAIGWLEFARTGGTALYFVLFAQHAPGNSAWRGRIRQFPIAEAGRLNHFGSEAGEPLWLKGGAPRDIPRKSPGET